MSRVTYSEPFAIPFNRPSFPPDAWRYVEAAIAAGVTAGNGPFGKASEEVLASIHAGAPSLLTTSGTHALELSARLLDLKPGDEVVVPAFTFVSTASAFAWNGARPVLADVRDDTMNIDPRSVERLVTERTRAICIVHYGGVAAEPEWFRDFADARGLVLIEDNAHGLGGTSNGKPLGTFGQMSALSFHETKNVNCGEGGALILNDDALLEEAHILREKGTNRALFQRGLVDKYTWVDVGSSWVLSDILGAVLLAQLERLGETQSRRHRIWDSYVRGLSRWASQEGVRLPQVPPEAAHSAHMFALRMPSRGARDEFIAHMGSLGILCVFHYQCLSDSEAAQRLGIRSDIVPTSRRIAETIVRLPLFDALTDAEVARVVDAATGYRVHP